MQVDNIDALPSHRYLTREQLARKRYSVHPIVRPSAQVANTPLYGSVKRYCPTPYDQGSEGSCTANAFCGAYRTLCRRLGNADANFEPSRQFFYYHERVIENPGTDPSTLGDTGADVTDGAGYVQKYGICSEQTWPYVPPQTDASGNPDLNTSNLDTPPAGADAEALAHKIGGYSTLALGSTLMDDIEASIAWGTPVLIAIAVYQSFESSEVAADGMVPTPAPANYNDPNDPVDPYLGGHEMLAVGYSHEQQLLTVLNSWGQSWGHGGFCYIKYDYITNPNLGSEFAIINM